jgi:proteasome assembly chaperone (PAC2) family protein
VNQLVIKHQPKIKNARMIISFSGWMNGGDVSTGTVDYIKNKLKAVKFAEIKPEHFYIFNFPGTMEIADEFRPYARVEKGILKDFSFPKNEFYYHEDSNLILFKGKEPNINWDDYARYILELGEKYGLKRIYFIGSVASATPHTRGIRASCYCSKDELKKDVKNHGIKFTVYEGPGSITTYLTHLAKQKSIEMINFVAEIPIYIQSENPKAIKTMTEKLAKLLELDIDTSDLTKKNLSFEKKINQLLENQPQLVEEIKKLEENYDKEFFDDKGGFEEWLKKKGIDKL